MAFFKISALFLAINLISGSFVHAAPTLNADALLKNGKAAQVQNKSFAGLKVTDSCEGQATACIDGAIASCSNGKWDATSGRCAKSQSCFAVPSVTQDGTNLMCTSEKNALSVIDSTGATGGITGDGSATPSGDGDEPLASDLPSSTVAPTPTGAPAASTVTPAASDAPVSSSAGTPLPPVIVVSTAPTLTTVAPTETASPTDVPPISSADTLSLPSTDALPTATTDSVSATPTDTTPASVITTTVTVTVTPAVQTTLPPVTRTISPDEVIQIFSSILNQNKQASVTDAPSPSSSLAATPSSEPPSSPSPSASPDVVVVVPTAPATGPY